MNETFLQAVRASFPAGGNALTLGAPLHEGACAPEPIVRIPLAMMNRHGLIAGATGTGKTKTLQLMAEQLSAAGVPVFLADMKGDVSGIAAAGVAGDRIAQRATDTGYAWHPAGFPVEFLSLAGTRGAQVRATVTSFGPVLLAKVLELNDTQTSVLTMVFKYCDDRGLELLNFADLRAVLQHLAGDGAVDLAAYGALSKATIGVLLREMVELESQGAAAFFGEPELDLDDLLCVERDGRGLITVLELGDMQDKPMLFSTFMMWMLARLYNQLPEAGDLDQPKLVFFFDEAHLLFEGASKAFLQQVEQTVRLIRSKGVGVFFVTQSPKDVPGDILGQLGHKVQHALRAFTPNDAAALKAAARTFPQTAFYDIEQVLQQLGIGEALVTVLSDRGVPTPPVATRLIPPASRMAPLAEDELQQRLGTSAQVTRYAEAVDRVSAEEKLLQADADAAAAAAQGTPDTAQIAPDDDNVPHRGRAAKTPPSKLELVLKSPATRAMATTVAGAVTRGLMGALFGPPRRSSRRR